MTKRTGSLNPLATMTEGERLQVLAQLEAEGHGYREDRLPGGVDRANARALEILSAIRNSH